MEGDYMVKWLSGWVEGGEGRGVDRGNMEGECRKK